VNTDAAATAARVAVITGATRGLGLATARGLAARGLRVWVTGRDPERTRAAANELRASGLVVWEHPCDPTREADVDALFVAIDREHGRVDVLVNNAGATFGAFGEPFEQIAAERVAAAFDNNTLSAYRMCQRALPRMQRGGYGRIVQVSSGMGSLRDMAGGTAAYRISKTAMSAVTRIVHAQAGPTVKVNQVCPGWVRTDMGGAAATRSIAEGVAGILWAALLPDDGPSGGFFRDGAPLPW
jgi:NAD(P)-dependent dehydrogenase (short-subunit alcohol dehydrogenase family)